MNTPKQIYLDFSQPELRALIAEQVTALPGYMVADELPADLIIADKDQPAELPHLVLGKNGTLALPIRLGAVTDQLRYLLSPRLKHAPVDETPIKIGPFMMHTAESTLHHLVSGEIIRLTDKERLFLQSLYAAPGHALDRKTLLDTVWDYADGVETHTLETHLYRLRQKFDICGEAGLISSADGIYKLKLGTG